MVYESPSPIRLCGEDVLNKMLIITAAAVKYIGDDAI